MQKLNLAPELQNQIDAAANILDTGGTVAFPTETVYGLGADATNSAAVHKIYTIKQRPIDHPLIVHIGNINDLDHWAQNIPDSAWKLAHHFWPGPLTLILQRSKYIQDFVTGGQNTVGIRMPAHPVALALLEVIGPKKALAAPSANRFGCISPTTAQHVQLALGSRIDMIIDGGACTVGLESTIISFHDEAPKILRPGGITINQIAAVLSTSIDLASLHPTTVRVPGSLPAHYAPATPLRLIPRTQIWQQARILSERNFRIIVITGSDESSDKLDNPLIMHFMMPNDPVAYGRQLYAKLHQADQAAYDYLLIETPPDHPEWLAITDRLQRASHHFTRPSIEETS